MAEPHHWLQRLDETQVDHARRLLRAYLAPLQDAGLISNAESDWAFRLLEQMAHFSGLMLLALILLLVVLALPPFLVMCSPQCRGKEKIRWVLLTGFFSWLAWPFYVRARVKKTNIVGSDRHP